MVARENLRFYSKDLARSKAIACNPSTSDVIHCHLSTSNAFDGEVIRKNKSFKRGSRPEEVCLVSNGVKSSKGKNGRYCGVYHTKSQSKDSDAPMTKRSWKGKSKVNKRINSKSKGKKIKNDLDQDEEILRLAIKEVEYSKPMLQKSLDDLGAIKLALDNIKLSSHKECIAPMIQKVHASIDEIHEDVRSSTQNLQYKIERMCILKNKIAFLNENMKESTKEFWNAVKVNKRDCERQCAPQRRDNVRMNHNREFMYSISDGKNNEKELDHDYHTYIDTMHQNWNRVDPLGVFNKKYDADQQKVVQKTKWQPKPKDQRQFQNWNRVNNTRNSKDRRNCFKMSKNNNLPDEEVVVVPVDSISSVDKMLLKRLWNKTDGNFGGDFEYMYRHYRGEVFNSLKENLEIEGSNGKKRRKLGLAELAMNPNYVITEAQLTPKEMRSMEEVYPHKINRDSYEDVPMIECAYMAGGSFNDSLGEFVKKGLGRFTQQEAAGSYMQITASTVENEIEQVEDTSAIGTDDSKPATKKTTPPASPSEDELAVEAFMEESKASSSKVLPNDSLEDIMEEESSQSTTSRAIKQEEDMDSTFIVQYKNSAITIDSSTIHQINSIKRFYVPSAKSFEKERSDGHLDVGDYPFVPFPLTLKDISLPSDMVDNNKPVTPDDKLSILNIIEGCNTRAKLIRLTSTDEIAEVLDTVLDELETTMKEWVSEDTPFASYMCCVELAFYRRLLKYYNEQSDNLEPIFEQKFWYKYCMSVINRLTNKCYYYFSVNTAERCDSEETHGKSVSFGEMKQPTIVGGRVKKRPATGTLPIGTKVATGSNGDFPSFNHKDNEDTPSTIGQEDTTLFENKPNRNDNDNGKANNGGGGGDDPSVGDASIKSDSSDDSHKNTTKKTHNDTYKATKMMRDLLKVASSLGMEKLSMEGGLSSRRRKFETFESELRVILSLHDETSTVYENFPAVEPPSKAYVNKALGTFILAKLEGQAKTIALAHINDGTAMLQDLKRHCNKLTPQIKMDMHQRLITLKQSKSESATHYLARWRKLYNLGVQSHAFTISETEAVDICLNGMEAFTPIYTNQITSLLALRQSEDANNLPTEERVTLSAVEDAFIDLDTRISLKKKYSEGVHMVSDNKSQIKCNYCGKLGHKEHECRKKKRDQENRSKGNGNRNQQGSHNRYKGKDHKNNDRRPKRDIKDVTCYHCNKKGHYATDCPERTKQQANMAIGKEKEREYICMAQITDDSESDLHINPSTSSELTNPSTQSDYQPSESSNETFSEVLQERRDYFHRLSDRFDNTTGRFGDQHEAEPQVMNFNPPERGDVDFFLKVLTHGQEGNLSLYPKSAMSRLVDIRREGCTMEDKFYKIIRHAIQVTTLVECGGLAQLPEREQLETFNEIYAYYQYTKRLARANPDMDEDWDRLSFLNKAIEEVRLCMRALMKVDNFIENRSSLIRYWALSQDQENQSSSSSSSTDFYESLSDPSSYSEDSNDDFNEAAFMAGKDNTTLQKDNGDPSDIKNWAVDSGATSHFTPFLDDLQDAEPCEVGVTIADGSEVTGTFRGKVNLRITTNQGKNCALTLQRVIYVPTLNRRLFSVASFCKNKQYTVNFDHAGGYLNFGDGHDINTSYDAFRSPTTQQIHQMQVGSKIPTIKKLRDDVMHDKDKSVRFHDDVKKSSQITTKRPVDASTVEGAHKPPQIQKSSNDDRTKLITRDLEQWQARLAYAPFRDLLSGSEHGVWSDTKFRLATGSFNTTCKISLLPKTKLSKVPFPKAMGPFQRIFVDPVPGTGDELSLTKPFPCYLMIVDQFSRFISLEGMNGYSSRDAIETITDWTGRGKGLATLEMIEYIRSDAGTQFKSEEFQKWCKENVLTCELAAPAHQEMNSICEANWKRVKYSSSRMMIHASLSHHFAYFAYLYSIAILNVMPTRGLTKEHNKVTTPFELVRGYKPGLMKFHTFGCPVVYKKHNFNTKSSKGATAGLQMGLKGTFIGFPTNSAGFLIYVEQPLQGHGHFVISKDVAFDDNLDLALATNKHVFKGGLPIRSIGKGHIEPLQDRERETTGDVTQIGTASNNKSLAEVIKEGLEDEETDPEMPDLEPWTPDFSDSDDDEPEGNQNGELNNDLVQDDNIPPIINDDESTSSDIDSQQATDYNELLDDIETSEVIVEEQTTSRRSKRMKLRTKKYTPEEIKLVLHVENETGNQRDAIFKVVEQLEAKDESIDPFLPEPKNIKDFRKLPFHIQQRWLKALKKEIVSIIDNDTFKEGTIQEGEKPIPTMVVFKAKITSRGHLDKLKCRIVARGDMMNKEEEDTWSGCVAGRTVKVFLVDAAEHKRPVKQLDFVAAFLQALARGRLWIQLPTEYAKYFPELAKYFNKPQLLHKTIYGLIYASKYWNQDLLEFLIEELKFEQSLYDSSLLIKRFDNGDFIKMILHTDDALYFGSNNQVEKDFIDQLSKRFNLEDQGHTHWYLSHRIYREKDGSYIMDQEQYSKHLLKKFFPDNAPWGAPVFRDTPAPPDYVYSKENRPDEDEKREIAKKYPNLKLSSIVCSLLYLALGTRCDLLWAVGKMSKGCQNPSLKDYHAAFWALGYLRKYTGYGVKLYSRFEDSPVNQICVDNNITPREQLVMTDSSFQDCPDTGRSTCGYKYFYRGSLCDANSSMPVPVAMSSAEAEYNGASNAGTAAAHFRELIYDLKYLGTKEFDSNQVHGEIPSLILVDNQATVAMGKNYKVTKKNRHIARRYHYVKQGVKTGDHTLEWIKNDDMLADDLTKTQDAHKSLPHMERTLVKIPDYVKGYKSKQIGNR